MVDDEVVGLKSTRVLTVPQILDILGSSDGGVDIWVLRPIARLADGVATVKTIPDFLADM